jgi:hypothetical protein
MLAALRCEIIRTEFHARTPATATTSTPQISRSLPPSALTAA